MSARWGDQQEPETWRQAIAQLVLFFMAAAGFILAITATS